MKLKYSFPTKTNLKKTWGNLKGCSLAFSVAEIAKNYKNSNFVLIVVEDLLTAEFLEQELKFFLGIKKHQSSEIKVLNFADWETLPYDNFSPHQDIISNRLTTLHKLLQIKTGILIVSIPTLMHKVCPKSFVSQNLLMLKIGDKLDTSRFSLTLEQSSYHNVSQVTQHGEFAIRGSIVDIYPMGSHNPYRIDLFDDEIDNIRTFDPETQRSKDKISKIELLPGKEYPFSDDVITTFRNNWRDKFSGDPTNCSIYQDVSNGIAAPGLEYYLSLFFDDELDTIFSYIPEESIIVSVGDIESAAKEFASEIEKRYSQYAHNITRPILKPEEIFIDFDSILNLKSKKKQIFLSNKEITEKAGKENFVLSGLPEIAIEDRKSDPFTNLKSFVDSVDKTLFTVESEGRKDALKELFATNNVKANDIDTWQEFLSSKHKLNIIVSPVHEGVLFEQESIAIIPETNILGKRVAQKRRRKRKGVIDSDSYLLNLAELKIGDLVVHIEQGIGRYLGLTKISLSDGFDAEFLTLQYANEAKLYIPVSSLHLITRYSFENIENVEVYPLGSDKWKKEKKKALTKIRDVAAELLEIYAKRQAKQGFAYPAPDNDFDLFSKKFPFEETIDQEKAINDVVKDLVAAKPMDRVVCGDVGFGKTEVALRACYLAVAGGKQVAVLVPTTLLADQHYKTFTDRFAGFPVNIEVISRFKTAKEQKQVLEKLESGKCDIVIGTHKLIQDGVKFKNLGLLVIDEEHRFGVRQKDKFKALRSEIDILTLTATPIPRTLGMAFSGIRDLSIIATPPLRRLSVKTFVREYDENAIAEAIDREIRRGGQVYYLHNSVSTINKAAEKLEAITENARVAVAHGQMPEQELEKIMVDFYHRRFNILVCTTIIETGIDIPTANTIIIERADKFGLAQLHQLRGRVGRSHHQAYAFCLLPKESKKITSDARKRLEAISTSETLGAGFTLATHDLEIRGAGELLGEEQSGNINSIGFNLYMELIDHAVKSLQEGKEVKFETAVSSSADVDLQIPNLIPESYIPDVHTRLVLYKRISNAKLKDDLDALRIEMIDRFGLLPDVTLNLFKVTNIKLNSNQLGIIRIKVGVKGGFIEFIENNNKIDPDKVINLVMQDHSTFKFDGPSKIKLIGNFNQYSERLDFVNNILTKIS